MQRRDAHYPRQAQIEAYGHGGFRFAGMSHRGAILLLPSGVYAWGITDPTRINEASLRRLFQEA
jgi:uncharacterized protein